MIDEKKIPQEIKEIDKRLSNMGADLFLVGGSVRDLYLGIDPKEFDFEIFADKKLKEKYITLNHEEREMFRKDFLDRIFTELNKFGVVKKTGKSFGVFKMANKPFDFSFPRKEIKVGETRKDYDISLDPFMSFSDAQKRRDITINSLLYSVSSGKIIDNFGGIGDLESGIIRHVDPVTFIEDPLRVYRISQFVSRFGFKVSEETILLCSKVDFSKLSTERIHWELEKLFSGSFIYKGLIFLKQAKVLLKKHSELDDLLEKQEKEILEKAILIINHQEELAEKLTIFFISFLNQLSLKELLVVVSSILHTFTNNKKIKNKIIDNLKMLIMVLDYYNGRISLAKTVITLKEKIKLEELSVILNCYADLFLDKSSDFLNKMEELKIIISDFSPEIKGEDLEGIGISPSEKYKDILLYSVELQLKGMEKNEILKEIIKVNEKIFKVDKEKKN